MVCRDVVGCVRRLAEPQPDPLGWLGPMTCKRGCDPSRRLSVVLVVCVVLTSFGKGNMTELRDTLLLGLRLGMSWVVLRQPRTRFCLDYDPKVAAMKAMRLS